MGNNEGGWSRPVRYGVIIFQIALIGSLIRGLQLSYKAKDRVGELEQKRDILLDEQAELNNKAKIVQSEYYLEKIAREELQKSKPGETVVIMPENESFASLETLESKKNEELPNWQKWLDLLVK